MFFLWIFNISSDTINTRHKEHATFCIFISFRFLQTIAAKKEKERVPAASLMKRLLDYIDLLIMKRKHTPDLGMYEQTYSGVSGERFLVLLEIVLLIQREPNFQRSSISQIGERREFHRSRTWGNFSLL